MIVVDRLIERTIETKNPSVIGLDPDISKIPDCYKKNIDIIDPLQAAANAITAYNKDIIDTICDLVPAVKPQMAFYEKYGSFGVRAFEETVMYAKAKGLVVIDDAKRCDIGNTAKAYADGHLGKVETLNGEKIPVFDVDFLTVTPFLGSESITPFIDTCISYQKGVFILVKTSNSSSGEIQDVITVRGLTVSMELAEYVAKQADKLLGKYGYSPIGAVVGATYPEEAVSLRKAMPKSYFLVPGYGVQGGKADDILPCFNPDGLGAVVNSSRGVLYECMREDERKTCTREEYLCSMKLAVQRMQSDLYSTLKSKYPDMVY